ncbi:double-strand break repair protein MRE11 [Rhipicephalus sanguineus]|uniref:double-strand break repair protein MRE11 n=1 Tax=Rhipicephalus sanguineus TaxID=34632 RepID=UPI0018949D89|nr:double-strand break repair protein MRE11 [Rhipicephalus sanguineus]
MSSSDAFKILVATDLHLGYEAKDAERKHDSIRTFEEILQIATQQNVDFILLGGDMFHDNKPPRWVEHETLRLLRQYCLGDKPVQFEILSDQAENFGFCAFPNVNYEDANLNVSLPVFTIHGNHDDPTGSENLSIIDVLATSGLVNYFGKVTDLTNVRLSPVLLRKGRMLLALYGLGWIRDERLHRLFRESKVKMLRPREWTDKWFNLLVLHQNRAKHGLTDYIPEDFLDEFLDLVVWGHEHECLIDPEFNGRFHVTQPGSPVATSLCPGEAAPKHVGILEIAMVDGKKSHKLTKIRLKTVRPFYIKTVSLFDLDEKIAAMGKRANVKTFSEHALEFCTRHIEAMIEQSIRDHPSNGPQPKLPLIRLRVEHGIEHETFSPHLVARMFPERVANLRDIVLFTKRRGTVTKDDGALDMNCLQEVANAEALARSRVEDLVREYFEKVDDSMHMTVLTDGAMQQAMNLFVDKDCTDAIMGAVKMQEARAVDALKEVPESKLIEEISQLKTRFTDQPDISAEEIERRVTQVSNRTIGLGGSDDDNDEISRIEDFDDDDDEDLNGTSRSKRGRGRGASSLRRGRGRARAASSSANTSTRGRGRQKRVNL